MGELIDIASKIDVEEFFRRRVDGFKKLGPDQAVGLCPFHQDREASFSMNLVTGQCQCFAGCGTWNVVTFEAQRTGADNGSAFKSICEEFDVELEKKPEGYTVADYAREKKLSVQLLQRMGVRDGKGRVEIPYVQEDGRVCKVRYRYPEKKFKWSKGGDMTLYGLQFIKGIRARGYVVLVEGESDVHSLVQMAIPALGVPGATTFRAEWAEALDGLDVILHDEGDGGAEAFKKKVLENLGRPFKVFRTRDLDQECKDPNALMWKHGPEKASEMLHAAIAAASDYEAPEGLLPGGCHAPEGYLVNDSGVWVVKDDDERMVSSTPMWLSSTIRCTETGTEKAELTYVVAGRRLRRIFDRDLLLAARTVVSALAPLGVNVSSETAAGVVAYLSAFDAVNHDALPVTEAAPRLGWAGGDFVPYGNVKVDDGIDERKKEYLDGFLKQRGTLEEWVLAMEPHRANPIFRFVMSASFASPLLEMLGGRVFMVYNWAGSRSGKTAALKAAMSVWGDPDKIVSTFNGTQNAIESIAGFFNNLPLAIDERQMRTGKGAQDALDQLVYTLSSGRGKDRGTRSGGLRSAERWRNVVLSTGEMPISGSSSQTGVMTRTIEVVGSPFDGDEAKARDMHEAVRRLHGTAGKVYVAAVASMGKAAVEELYERMRDEVVSEVRDMGSVSSHVDGACTVALADYLASVSVFGYEDPDFAWTYAKLAAAEVLKGLDKEMDVDVGERAHDVILDWIATNADKFKPDSETPFTIQGRLGEKRPGGYAIIGTRLREELERNGLNVKQVVKQLGEKGVFRPGSDGKFTQQMLIGDARVRCYFMVEKADSALRMQEALNRQGVAVGG